MNKLTREQKIESFTKIYTEALLRKDNTDFAQMNHSIIESVGISGLKEVKRRAWN